MERKKLSRADRLRDPRDPLKGWPTVEQIRANPAPTNKRLIEMQRMRQAARAESIEHLVAGVNTIGRRAATKDKAWLATLEMLERTAKEAAPKHLAQAQALITLLQRGNLTVAEWNKLRVEAEQLFQNLKPHMRRQ